MRTWKKMVSLGLAAVLALQCGEGLVLAAEDFGQEAFAEAQTEEVQVGSEV